MAAALLLSGILAFNFLPVASLPKMDFPVISVGAGLPGADPQTMASAVATPLERQFGRIAAVNVPGRVLEHVSETAFTRVGCERRARIGDGDEVIARLRHT